MPGRDDRALGVGERRDADDRRHRLVQVEQVELLLGQRVADPEHRARREDDVRERAVRRHDDGAADRDDPGGQVAVPTGARMQEPREPAGRIVPHQDLDVVPAVAQRGRLVLGVLDDPAPVRPRERDDDPDLHARAPAKMGASRSIPASSVSSVTESERRAQPAPDGPEALAGRDGDPVLGRAGARRSTLRAT